MGAVLEFGTGGVAVFGGSGGAGSAVCRGFAEAGCNIAFTYLAGVERARALEAELQRHGVAVSAHRLDLTDAAETASTFDAMVERHGQIHTVVYAAGPHIEISHVANVKPERFRLMVETELLGFFHILHAAVPHLRKIPGNIVACTTYANRRVLPNDGESAAPKGGIESLVRQMAREEGQYGLRANCVGLGWLDVGQGTVTVTERSNITQAGGAEMWDYMRSIVPLGRRPGTGPELAAAVLFMASKQASYITGQTLVVDGGATV